MLDFNHDDETLVDKIVDRWIALVESHGHSAPDFLHTMMDVMAANGANGNSHLDLWKLLHFDDANFAHDMGGISRHINRENGTLEGGFLPRCAKAEDDG